jgi:hypothetical protein
MAFSLSIAKELIKLNTSRDKTPESMIKNLDKSRLWVDIKSVCDTDVVNRYMKYIYNYLNEFTTSRREPKYTEGIDKPKKDNTRKSGYFGYFS